MRELMWRLRAMLRRDRLTADREEELQFHHDMAVEAGLRRGASPGRGPASRPTAGRRRLAWRRVDARGDGRRLARRRRRRSAPCGPRADPQSRVRRRRRAGARRQRRDQHAHLLHARRRRAAAAAVPDRPSAWCASTRSARRSRSSRCPSAASSTIAPTRARSKSIALYTGQDMELSGVDGRSEQLSGVAITSDFFTVLGKAAARSAAPSPTADLRRNTRLVIISHRLWRDRFISDPAIVGKADPPQSRALDDHRRRPRGLPARRRRVPLAAPGRDRRHLDAARHRSGDGGLTRLAFLQRDRTYRDRRHRGAGARRAAAHGRRLLDSAIPTSATWRARVEPLPARSPADRARSCGC